MIAHIITIGDEILIGQTLNTNAACIGDQLTNIQISVNKTSVVGDDHDDIMAEFKTCWAKNDLLIVTGGLGPTFDDKTLESIAKALNRKLEVDKEALEMVKEKYQKYARKKRSNNEELAQPRVKMATIPENSMPIRNPLGTAPAVQINLENTVLIALPGVPREMEVIFEQTAAPMLKRASHGSVFCEESIYADDVMESALAPLIDKVMIDNPDVYVKSHPRGAENKPHMEIHFSMTTAEEEKAQEKLHKAVTQLSDMIIKIDGKVFPEQQVSS